MNAYDLIILLRIWNSGEGEATYFARKTEPQTRSLRWLVDEGMLRDCGCDHYQPTHICKAYIKSVLSLPHK